MFWFEIWDIGILFLVVLKRGERKVGTYIWWGVLRGGVRNLRVCGG